VLKDNWYTKRYLKYHHLCGEEPIASGGLGSDKIEEDSIEETYSNKKNEDGMKRIEEEKSSRVIQMHIRKKRILSFFNQWVS
jgi:hypothetical protein